MELLKEYEKDHPEVDFIIRDGESSQRRQNRDVLDMLEEPVDGNHPDSLHDGSSGSRDPLCE